MRKIMLLAAVVGALAMASQVAEARDRGSGSRHFSAHSWPKLHLRHHGLNFHYGGAFGKDRPFKSRHFGHFGQGGLVLKLGDGDFVLRFGHIPFSHHHFSYRQHHPGLFFGLDQPRHLTSWHDRGFAWEIRRELAGQRPSRPVSEARQGGGPHGGAPPEALLQQLERMGFRHVPELLRSRDP